MPFVPKQERDKVEKSGSWETPGQLCYMKYLPMIEAWRKERRWTTAHNLFKETFNVGDEEAAKTLAYLVFFVHEVMDYEREKIKENGDIDGRFQSKR